jgi:hypothetical protein
VHLIGRNPTKILVYSVNDVGKELYVTVLGKQRQEVLLCPSMVRAPCKKNDIWSLKEILEVLSF